MSRLRGGWLRQSHRDAAHRYFERFGSWTIVIARFIPFVRMLAPLLAGAGKMPWLCFALFNVAGAFVWVALLVYAGASLGAQPLVRDRLSAITMAIVALSTLPVVLTGLRALWSSGPNAS